MEVGIGSTVECVDGDAGKIAAFIVERESMKLVGLVVSKGRIVSEAIVVPMEVVRNLEPNRVYLRLTVRELGEEYHRLKESEYVPLADEWKPPPPDSPEELVVTTIPAVGSEPPLVPIQSDLEHPFILRELTNIPEDAVSLSGETQIVCPEGPVGKLEKIVLDPTTNKATHIVLRLHIEPYSSKTVPVYLINQLEEDVIFLKARRVFLENLPSTPEIEN